MNKRQNTDMFKINERARKMNKRPIPHSLEGLTLYMPESELVPWRPTYQQMDEAYPRPRKSIDVYTYEPVIEHPGELPEQVKRAIK